MLPIDRFRVLCAASMVDGALGDRERAILISAATELGVDKTTYDQVIADVKRLGAKSVTVPEDRAERQTLFRLLVDVVAADGQIEPAELAMFKRIGPAFKIHELEVEDLLRSAADAARAKRKPTGKKAKKPGKA
jgi:uncharacterized tellurite resistance protein B-like protein